MKNFCGLFICIFLANLFSIAQVPKKVVVEHFTNTVCSVCASKNPGFYTNLKAHSGVLHLALHPSSPYASCIFNQHNKSENDARTNYYGVFGGTPRLVIQGTVISSSANYSAATLFTPYLGQTSPASIKIIQTKFGSDSIRSTIIIKTESAHSLGTLKLYVALAEDTVFYASPNGETKHYDVFRKALTAVTGTSLTLPSTVGDSLVFSFSSPKNVAWNFSRIYTMAILQVDASKSVVQAEAVLANSNTILTAIANAENAFEIEIFPIPANDMVHIKMKSTIQSVLSLYDITGGLVFTQGFSGNTEVPLSNLLKGQYLLIVENKVGRVTKQIFRQ